MAPRTTLPGRNLVASKGWSRESIQCQLSCELRPAAPRKTFVGHNDGTGRQLARERQVSCWHAPWARLSTIGDTGRRWAGLRGNVKDGTPTASVPG
ncbi:MAG: hypothetical protein QOC89_908 [Paraburkholderia sp.]|nr:hypothetical protein [Paraburkholderia sp.]